MRPKRLDAVLAEAVDGDETERRSREQIRLRDDLARRLTAGVGDGDGPLAARTVGYHHDSVAGGASGPLREEVTRSPSGCGSPASRSMSTGGSWRLTSPISRAGRGGAGRAARPGRYRLEAEDDGTRFDYRNWFALPGGGLGKLAGGLLAAAPGKREASRSLERLRMLLGGLIALAMAKPAACGMIAS